MAPSNPSGHTPLPTPIVCNPNPDSAPDANPDPDPDPDPNPNPNHPNPTATQVKGNMDSSNFDSYEDEPDPPYLDDGSGWDKDF